MRAGRAGRDPERAADFLVRAPRCHQTHDLELAAGESGDALTGDTRRRTRAHLAHLLARGVELALGAEVLEDIVRATQFAHRTFTVARFGQRSRELTAQARRVGNVRNRLERIDRAGEKCYRFVAIA